MKTGNERQQLAYQTLIVHRVLEKLAEYSPILTGTIPINIDIENSDLDIICYWEDKREFIMTLTAYSNRKVNFKFVKE